ncbi:sigma-w pathway protein ysdB [Virgibacillus sp. LDC-1]|uniref:sigma-w pathway protein ysdB n=1 Tax=Virgibacillus sp. LDC-1 TaxID=3039856 RepID=UPI0032E7F76B
MMVVVLFRILIIISLLILIYTGIQYYRNPKRRLHIAQSTNEFFLLDDPTNSKKNLHFVYKGCLFEGEKYLGTTENSFEVVNIQVIVNNPLQLKGLTREDLYFLEEELLIRYPFAKINWKHPINQLLLKQIEKEQ